MDLDSIAYLNLTINYSGESHDTISACDNFLWNEQVYTTSGNYSFQTQTEAGCDSIAYFVLNYKL